MIKEETFINTLENNEVERGGSTLADRQMNELFLYVPTSRKSAMDNNNGHDNGNVTDR